ncbi:MAG: hypothetical protein IKX36_00955 [Prevotella sp.]|nr:hypothetical protein [Prevotella sp.]
MKKFLLLSAAILAFSTGAFAQQQKVILPKKQVTTDMIKEAKNVSFATNKQVAKRRAVEDGFYYLRPPGALYNTIGPDFRYSYFPLMYVGVNGPVKFYNACEDPTVAYWEINGRNMNEEEPDYIDEGNNFYMEDKEEGFEDSGWYYMPILTDGGKFQFYWAEDADDIGMELTGGYVVEPYVAVADTVEWMSLVCGEMCKLYGSINSGYPYGTRDVSDLLGEPAGSYRMNGIWQFYDKPISPFWFDQVSLLVKSDSETPLAEGSSLKMKIVKAGYNEKGYAVYDEDEVIAELEAKPEDMVVTSANDGNWYALIFKNEVEDDFGVSIEPVVVEDAFAVIIDGFFDKGVDVCLFASDQTPYDEDWIERTLWRLVDPDGNLIADTWGWVGCNTFLSFSGIFDGAKVVEKETYEYTDGTVEEFTDLNYLKIGDDKKSVNMGDNSVNYAAVKTVMPWFDSNDNEQYYFEMPDWLETTDNQILHITGQYSDGSEYTYGWGLAFTATSDVPEGSTVNGKPGRFAEIVIEGKGIVSKPIYVLQGDITKEDVLAELENPTGINTVKADNTANSNKTYSLTGAQVNKHHHGVVIRNGKKMIQK